jgi:hypothetical protein
LANRGVSEVHVHSVRNLPNLWSRAGLGKGWNPDDAKVPFRRDLASSHPQMDANQNSNT